MKPALLIYIVKLQALTRTVGLKCPARSWRPSITTSVSRDLSKSCRIVDSTGIDGPVGANQYGAGSGNWVFIDSFIEET